MMFLKSIRQIAFRTFDNNISLIVILDVRFLSRILNFLSKFVEIICEDVKSVKETFSKRVYLHELIAKDVAYARMHITCLG